MKRRLPHHHHSNASEATKFSKLLSTFTDSYHTTIAVQIILIDFCKPQHSELSSCNHSSQDLEDSARMYQFLKTKFENQSKGFKKYLLAREEWMRRHNPWDNCCQMKIEFMNDRECVASCLNHHIHYSQLVQRMVQTVNLSELCRSNQEMIGKLEFWTPFKSEILRLIKIKQLHVLKYIPKNILLEWKQELSQICEHYYDFSFIFDLDDFDEAKKVLSEKRCMLFQLSQRLRDNEEIVMHAVRCLSFIDMQHISKRLTKDRKFCVKLVHLNPNLFLRLPSSLKNDKEFIIQLFNTTLTSDDGTLYEDKISTCIPEVFFNVSARVCHELSLDFKLSIYLQLFLKDAIVSNIELGLLKPVFQMLHELPDEYYRAHKNYQNNLTEQGRFVSSLFNECEQHRLQNDDEFGKIVEQVMKRICMNYGHSELDDEDLMLKRISLPFILKYTSDRLKNNRNFVLRAVKSNGKCYRDVLPIFQNDREIVLAAVSNTGSLLYEQQKNRRVLPAQFRNDKEVILAALKSGSCSFSNIPTHLYNDKDVVLTALEYTSLYESSIAYAVSRFFERNDREVIIATIQKNGHYLNSLSYDFSNDRDLLLAAIRNNQVVYALQAASNNLKQDQNFVLDCVKANPSVLNFVCYQFNKEIRCNFDILYEHAKRWGFVMDELIYDLVRHNFGDRDINSITFHESVKIFTDLKRMRLEFEYFGCHIPESHLLKEPIEALEVEPYDGITNLASWDSEYREKMYSMWKAYLFGNEQWEIFFSLDLTHYY
ncbi:hypothetical protein C9374_008702 [Naegleria lovaniensis]|uniref:DUF4116 domain-containing protein n=1 Tax=Naegleria lovaniensis TaxID=51637 RepID=A0AA88GJR8_NAELO|nr:uncharacterized protein C9374_008702 [Naegleria lovaniensis]KAG2378080.1 hypothetical protein C9374_008702 [Naegleria lovaniensis]